MRIKDIKAALGCACAFAVIAAADVRAMAPQQAENVGNFGVQNQQAVANLVATMGQAVELHATIVQQVGQLGDLLVELQRGLAAEVRQGGNDLQQLYLINDAHFQLPQVQALQEIKRLQNVPVESLGLDGDAVLQVLFKGANMNRGDMPNNNVIYAEFPLNGWSVGDSEAHGALKEFRNVIDRAFPNGYRNRLIEWETGEAQMNFLMREVDIFSAFGTTREGASEELRNVANMVNDGTIDNDLWTEVAKSYGVRVIALTREGVLRTRFFNPQGLDSQGNLIADDKLVTLYIYVDFWADHRVSVIFPTAYMLIP